MTRGVPIRRKLENEDFRLMAAIGIGIGSDLLDYAAPVFLSPIIGEPLDIISILAIFYLLRDWRVAIAAMEFIPFGDTLPFYTFVTLWIAARQKIAGKRPKIIPSKPKKPSKVQLFSYTLIALVVATIVFGTSDMGIFSLLP